MENKQELNSCQIVNQLLTFFHIFRRDLQVAPSAFPLKPALQISTNLSEVVRKNLED